MAEEQKHQPEKKGKTIRLLWAFPIFLAGMCTGAILLAVFALTFPTSEGSDVDPTTEVVVVELTVVPTDTLIPEQNEAPTDTLVPEPTEAVPTDTQIPEPTATVEVLLTDTPVPEPTTWVGVIYCPECEEENIPLALWEDINKMGNSPGKVNHGDTCIVLDKGVTEESPGVDPGIEKYKLDCDGKIGWLRAEGVKPAE